MTTKPTKKIAIVAKCPSSRMLAPFADPSWEIWSCSPTYIADEQRFEELPRLTLWHELHNLDEKFTDARIPGYAAWLQKLGDQVVIRAPDPRLPRAQVLPRTALLERFGNYFTNTVSWQIAHAMLEGATTIGLFGVDMAHNSEYGHQRPSCEYFCGLARGLGIELVIPDECDLLKTGRLYGVEDPAPYEAKMWARLEELQARIEYETSQRDGLHQQLIAHAAALTELKALRGQLNGQATPELSALLDQRQAGIGQRIAELKQTRDEQTELVLRLAGAEENQQYALRFFGG